MWTKGARSVPWRSDGSRVSVDLGKVALTRMILDSDADVGNVPQEKRLPCMAGEETLTFLDRFLGQQSDCGEQAPWGQRFRRPRTPCAAGWERGLS